MGRDGKIILDKIDKRRRHLQKAFAQAENVIRNYTKDYFGDLFNAFDEEDDHYPYDFELMDRLIKQVLHLFAPKG